MSRQSEKSRNGRAKIFSQPKIFCSNYCSHWTSQLATGVNRALPIFVVFICLYAIYVYCIRFSWSEVVQHHSRAVGIAYICIFSVLLFFVALSWLQLLVLGPGHVPRISPYIRPTSMPEVFICDPYGYPLWCSHCQSVKPDRCHHSSEVGRCVPRMDHYCSWVGSLIGLRNHKAFLQFVFYFLIFLMFVVITMCCYVSPNKHRKGRLDPHFLVIILFSGFWILLLLGFLGVQVYYLLINVTTVENMKLKRGETPIYNVLVNGHRAITKLPTGASEKAYDQGKWSNWKSIMGPNIFYWIFPLIVSTSSTAQFAINENILMLMKQRYLAGEEGYPMIMPDIHAAV